MEFSRQEYWSGLPFLSLNLCTAAAAKLLQSCPPLFDPIDGSPPGSSVPGILQARTLQWVAISFSSHSLEVGVKEESLTSFSSTGFCNRWAKKTKILASNITPKVTIKIV